ncbi:MAG: caspase family protein [Hyphomicrobiales bacterium]
MTPRDGMRILVVWAFFLFALASASGVEAAKPGSGKQLDAPGTGTSETTEPGGLTPPGAGGEPELLIEPGTHTAPVRHVILSPDQKTMITASFDKTIRLWSVPDGKLLKILRVPIGEGFEGSLFGLAISPDGKTLAVGGWMKQQYIYTMDIVSGKILRAYGPNDETLLNVSFSPDGKSLAAVFNLKVGMRIWDVATGQLKFEDKDYGGETRGLAFRSDGYFATASHDGLIRFYNPDGSFLAKVPLKSGQQGSNIAFSPDGNKLAITYNDGPLIDILNVSDFSWLPAPDISGFDNGDVGAVAWSQDGQYIYAGGRLRDAKGWYQLVRWGGQGNGERSTVHLSANTIFDIEPYGPDGVVFANGQPALNIYAGGQIIMGIYPATAGMGLMEKGSITASEDGTQVRFAFDYGATQQYVFDLKTLELKDVKGIADTLKGADTTSLPITKWNTFATPELNGKPLDFEIAEVSHSVSVADDKSKFVIGSSWYIREYDKDGRFLWRSPIAGSAWGVTYAQNGNLIIAAVGDGTIRWFRASDGKPLLSLFVQTMDNRWILWTPRGYYAASAGGENLIGWNVNRGETVAPDYFPASSFRHAFYRPDVVQKVVAALDEETAIQTANVDSGRKNESVREGVRDILPPVVELVMDSDEINTATSPVEVKYKVRSPNGEPIESVEVLIDGRPLEARGAMPIPDPEETEDISIPIPQKSVEIGIIARTKSGASEAKIVKVNWDGSAAELLKPKLYAVVVGVSNYDVDSLKLRYAAQDATDFAAGIKRQEGGIYGKVEVRLLTDKGATRDSIVEALEWLEGEVTSRDVGMVFMAGHGVTDNRQRFYYLPSDADMDKLRSTAVSRDEMLNTMSNLAGKALMFIDACHSAASLEGEQTRGSTTDITAVVNELSSVENGVVMFASSTGSQVSIERDDWKNGAFTEALLEGLSGSADYIKDGKLTIAELDLWLSERVKQLTDKRQAPVARKPDTVPDFPIAMVR